MLRGEAPAPADRLRTALRRAAERLIYYSVNSSDWSSEKSVGYVAGALPSADELPQAADEISDVLAGDTALLSDRLLHLSVGSVCHRQRLLR